MDLLYASDAPGADAPSWYAATAARRPETRPLEGAARADICVVGGGYTGLSAALTLAERGYRVTLLEAHRVGWGASGRNGGQVGHGQRLDPETLDRMVGRTASDQLWHLAAEAVREVKDRIARHAIACDLRPGIIHAAHRARLAEGMRAEAALLAERYGYETEILERRALADILGTEAYHFGVAEPLSAHLHPLNYAIGLAAAAAAAGVRIHEMSPVTGIERGPTPTVRTGAGHVVADHVILACNGYLGGLVPEVAARVMPINNFIIATEPLPPDLADTILTNGYAVADTKFVVNYYRPTPDGRLLFGGRESYGYRFPRDIKNFVRKAMVSIYPQLRDVRIDYGWGGTLAITMSRAPHFARIGPNILSLSGYSGHGVAMATLAGKLGAEAVAGQAERFDLMAAMPTPRFPGGPAFRQPLLVLAMLWYSLRDRL